MNSLLSWFIATKWKQFSSLCTVLYWRLCGLTNSPIVKYSLNWGWYAWSAEGSVKQWLPNGKLLLLTLTKCHGVPCSLPSRITTKVFENCRTFSSRPKPNVQDRTKISWSKTKTFIFVLEAPQDQDPGLEDYITARTMGLPGDEKVWWYIQPIST